MRCERCDWPWMPPICSCLEPPQHREDATMVLLAQRQIELGEDAVDVLLNRARGDRQAFCDRRVRTPLGHEAEDLALAPREAVERRSLAGPREALRAARPV